MQLLWVQANIIHGNVNSVGYLVKKSKKIKNNSYPHGKKKLL